MVMMMMIMMTKKWRGNDEGQGNQLGTLGCLVLTVALCSEQHVMGSQENVPGGSGWSPWLRSTTTHEQRLTLFTLTRTVIISVFSDAVFRLNAHTFICFVICLFLISFLFFMSNNLILLLYLSRGNRHSVMCVCCWEQEETDMTLWRHLDMNVDLWCHFL